ncbi:class I SAM-dependent methyltransferase [Streptomyces endophytica]|uniref:Class I SAM-dependent methyltransferase n=1 Tax=Streptomyces endophytica TaxID=2991496 RepID=A0ABY6PD60_9ACTN|nr:class I SAM-dependent methyltransferase [Streptomyces endophytica]UZJ31503.1 class I SAM-dependent methyltransferase [Streptomyces endophytica]
MTSPRSSDGPAGRSSHGGGPGIKVRLTGEKETLLPTLHARAVDCLSPDPILGDTMALDALRRIDSDFDAMRLSAGDAVTVALRARQLDRWTAQFLERHDDAVVVHLGCGLDTRVHRLAPGPGVRWFDVDFPEVIDLRRELYPAPAADYTAVPSSVTDPAWVAQVPPDRPTMIVAEGLLMYLTEEDATALLRRLIVHAPHGAAAFDVFGSVAIRTQRLSRVLRKAGARVHWATDRAGIAALSPRLRIVEDVSALELPGIEKLPPVSRLAARAAAKVPGIRDTWRLYHCRF